MYPLPIASRTIKITGLFVSFLAPVGTYLEVLHLLSAGKEESGAKMSAPSAVMVRIS